MDKIPFEDGKKLKNAFVTIDGKEHEVTPAQYQGKTPMSSFNLNKMQNNIDNAKAEKTEVSTLNTKVTNLENTKANKTELIPQELDVSSLLANSWALNGLGQIYKVNNIVTVAITVQNGNATQILALPEGYRPHENMFFTASAIGDTEGNHYCNITADGKLYIPSANVGKLITMNFSFFSKIIGKEI